MITQPTKGESIIVFSSSRVIELYPCEWLDGHVEHWCSPVLPVSDLMDFTKSNVNTKEFLVSKETVVLRRWERSKQKFSFIKRVDKG